ncbi:MAG: hypothetical protein P1U56_22840 [Saprospiraceae bacterium]|nr:hypothetical protein [Saprospiraceae bacterium]
MSYKYSICYPDKEEIDFPEEEINGDQVIELVKNFNWDDELKKEIEVYSPSLDFIRISNKRRLILSGIGEGKLEEFQIMYSFPNDENASKAFDAKNYYMSEEYTVVVGIEEAYEILKAFLDQQYDVLLSKMQIDTPTKVSDSEALQKYFKDIPTIIDHTTTHTYKKWWEFWK